MSDLDLFIDSLRKYKHTLPQNAIKTIKGQALAGNIDAARKGLQTALNKKG